jgi:trimeric autotransporter adhesin
MAKRLLALVLLVFAALVLSCAAPQQASIDIAPQSVTLVTGGSVQLTVTRRFPGGGVDDVTNKVVYSSSNRTVALVNEKGFVTAQKEPGSVLVRVVDRETDATSFISLTIVPPTIESIEIDPSPAVVIRPGTARRFAANARLTDGTKVDVTAQVQWGSNNEAAATVGRAGADIGLVTGIKEGDTTVTATDVKTLVQGRTLVFVRGESPQLIAIHVTPNPETVTKGQKKQFSAKGILNDGTDRDMTKLVAWSSSKTDVATIDADGMATGVLAGDTTITATGPAAQGAVKGSAALKVE